LRIPDASTVDAAANLKSAASPVKATEHEPASEAVQDEVNVGAVALAASTSIDAPDSRVAELRQQVLDGSYQVDSARLSSKIIDEHLEK
jgi:anti-sigma28 factor (negative regulator of flagellin synthesis)